MPHSTSIITHYHLTNNYGGNLQSYALCEALRQLGARPVQLQIPVTQISDI